MSLEITSDEIAFIIPALTVFKDSVYSTLCATSDPIAHANCKQNLASIKSAREKLEKHSSQFTVNEIRMICLSATDMRSTLNATLDEPMQSTADRDTAQEMLRLSNAVLRKFKAILATNGIKL